MLGEAGEISKKIWSLHASVAEEAERKMQEHAQFHVDHMFSGNGSDNSHECEDFHEELRNMKRKASLLRNLFWMSVDQEIGGTKESLKIAKGWKIVKVEESTKEHLRGAIIGSLLNLFEE